MCWRSPEQERVHIHSWERCWCLLGPQRRSMIWTGRGSRGISRSKATEALRVRGPWETPGVSKCLFNPQPICDTRKTWMVDWHGHSQKIKDFLSCSDLRRWELEMSAAREARRSYEPRGHRLIMKLSLQATSMKVHQLKFLHVNVKRKK